MQVGAKLEGLEGTLKQLKELGRRVRNKVLRQAAMAASKPILDAAKAKVPVVSGLLRKSLGRRVQIRGANFVVWIGPRRGMKEVVTMRDGRQRAEDPANIGHLVEGPVRPHTVGKGSALETRGKKRANQHGGMHPGYEGARFMHAAFDEQKMAAEAIAKRKLLEGIEEAAR